MKLKSSEWSKIVLFHVFFLLQLRIATGYPKFAEAHPRCGFRTLETPIPTPVEGQPLRSWTSGQSPVMRDSNHTKHKSITLHYALHSSMQTSTMNVGGTGPY